MGVFIFRLSYKIMVIVLIAFSLTVTLCPYIDDPILCIVGSVLGNVNGTYSSNDSTVATANRITHECIDKDEHRRGTVVVRDRGEIGIIFVLLFQALLFYIPRYLWKDWKKNKAEADVYFFRYCGIPMLNLLIVVIYYFIVGCFLDRYSLTHPTVEGSLFLLFSSIDIFEYYSIRQS